MYQAQPLPGAYYGPAVPPKHQRKSRGCFCCLLSTFFKILIGLVILLGVLALVLWLVLRPVEVKAYVRTASLTQFNLSTVGGNDNFRYNLTAVGRGSIGYNLSTVIDIRNPNKRIGLYYDSIEAIAYYEGERFAWKALPAFYQGHKNTTTLYPAFSGQSTIDMSISEVQDFELHRQAGTFDVTLHLRSRIRFKLGSSFKTSRTTMKIKCNMALPYGKSFSGTKCDVDW
ncbi:unnamed protein product [Spirodela intermedia]|uniref:Late embryogenesis abundant protein LEA-2 subgroup domain-containing protein n=1 Tax=Spirodela intermedia TaxID=51605 RepID=A0A7I8KH50_SPIIN|nr:unnamed protein product [Spirodela intermedia]